MAHATSWKRGKYAGAKFTADQRKARRIWVRQQDRLNKATEAFQTQYATDREEFLRQAARCWDACQRGREKAHELFPEVGESFTIASMEVVF